MSAAEDAAVLVLGIAKEVAPELLAIARYASGEVRDPDEELRLAMALIRKATDARARREIGG